MPIPILGPGPAPVPFIPEGPRALGFRGESAPARPPGTTLSVTLRRICGRADCPPDDDGALALPIELWLAAPPVAPKEEVKELLSLWRRAFSCLACSDRKCVRSSCHLISSRPNLDRDDIAAPGLCGISKGQRSPWCEIVGIKA